MSRDVFRISQFYTHILTQSIVYPNEKLVIFCFNVDRSLVDLTNTGFVVSHLRTLVHVGGVLLPMD